MRKHASLGVISLLLLLASGTALSAQTPVPATGKDIQWLEAKTRIAAEMAFGNGMKAKAGDVTVWYQKDDPAKQIIASFTLAEDFSFPNGMKAKAGKMIRYWSNQTLRSLPLATDWQIPGGALLKGGTEVWLSPEGNWQSVVTAADFSLGQDRPVAKAGKTLSFHPDNSLHELVLAQDFPLAGTPVVCAAGTFLSYDQAGKIDNFTPKAVFTSPAGLKFKAMGSIRMEKGVIVDGMLAEDFAINSDLVIRGYIQFAPTGQLTRAELAKVWNIPGTKAWLKEDSIVRFNDDGSFQSGTLAWICGFLKSNSFVTARDIEKAFDPTYYQDKPDEEEEYDESDLEYYL